MNTDVTPLPSPPPSAHARPLGGLPDLLLFLLCAVALLFLVQFAALAPLLYDAHQHDPSLTWRQLMVQAQRRVQFDAFFAVPVQLAYYAAIILLLYALVSRRRKQPFWSSLAWRRVSPGTAGLALAGGLALALFIQLANVLVPPPEPLPFDRFFSSRAAAWLIIAASLLAAPLVEELVFRGYIYSLLEPLWGRAAAVLWSGVLFGAIHVPQLYPGHFQILLLCAVGIVFSLARAGTGTLLASILLHLSYNATLSALFLVSEQFRQLATLP